MANDAAVDYRALLEGEQASLRRQLEEIGYGHEGHLSYDANFADSSQVTAERGEAEALAAQLNETLERVVAALRRVSDGTYGVCERCSKPIGEARLEANPASTLCIDCASLVRR